MVPHVGRPHVNHVPTDPLSPAADALFRRTIGYVTIDDADYMASPSTCWTHQANLDRLRQIAAGVTPALEVQPLYFMHPAPALLDDPRVLALFLAGSWPEWITVRRQPEWARALERFCAFIRSTTIPIFAVCGSHQLVANGYAGWNAVAHMRRRREGPAPTVADEIASGASLIPRYRIGEVGAFPMVAAPGAEADPILNGLGGTRYFIEYHHDEVVESERSQLFDAVLKPARNAPAIQDRTVRFGQGAHAPVDDPEDRSDVQLLRLRSDDRVLYTSQFHPELSCGTVCSHVTGDISGKEALYFQADANGERLLHNFFCIARAFWQRTCGG